MFLQAEQFLARLKAFDPDFEVSAEPFEDIEERSIVFVDVVVLVEGLPDRVG